jgi:hypothetical protein
VIASTIRAEITVKQLDDEATRATSAAQETARAALSKITRSS